jgi:hypothetical protein
MSLFAPLQLTVPRIAYCVLHQRKASVGEEEYVRTLVELTRQAAGRATEASGRIRAWRAAQAEESTKGASPEVTSKVQALLEAVAPVPAVEAGLELATVEVALPEGRLSQLVASGREYLTSLGLRTAAGEAPIHYSVLLFTGSWNYDFVEHIVRDLMGIYQYPHLQHIQELGQVVFFTQNQVAAIGDPTATEPGEWEPAIFFSKGKPTYAEFRAALTRAMDRAMQAPGLKAISLWQRKLGMGNIFEWELRLRCPPDPERLAGVLDALAAEGGAVAERVASRGRMLIYHRID